MTPFRTIIIFIVVSLAGLALVPKLQVNLNPPPIEPVIYVSYSVSEATPALVEQLATSPLENAFSTLHDLKEINSTSNYNQGRISLRFDKKAAMDQKRFEVAMLIRQVYPKMDVKVSYPYISTYQQDRNQVFLQYTLNAPFAPFEIKRVGEDVIARALADFQEIENINFRGADELCVNIQYRLDRMLRFGITKADITAAIQKSFGTWYPGLATIADHQRLFIKLEKSITQLVDIENTVIKSINGQAIHIKDVAKVSLEEEEPSFFYRINGKNFVNLSIYAREGINKVHVGKRIKEKIEQAQLNLPQGYDLRLVYDETEFLEEELSKIYQRSLLSICILILFIFLINRNPKYLLVLFSGIIVNLAITSLVVYWLQIPVHLYSLAGLTISFGLIVDNAIVMIDHLYKHKNRKVFLALLAASLTTISALLLVFLLPEEERLKLSDFSIIIAVTLSVSLVVALLFTPAMYGLLLKDANRADYLKHAAIKRRTKIFRTYSKLINFLHRRRKWLFVLLILSFGIPIFSLPSKWDDHKWYNSTIGSDLYQEHIRPWVDKGLGGSLRLFVRHVYERSSYRESERTRLYVNANLPYGNTLQQMDIIIKDFENYLLGIKGIDMFSTYVMSGENARIEIVFEEAYERSALPYQLKARLMAKSTDWSGARWSIYGVGQGFSTGGGEGIPSFRVKMLGYNYDELERQAERLAEKLLVHKRIQEVNTNERLSYAERKSKEYVLSLKSDKMASSGLNTGDMVQTISTYAKSTRPDMQLAIQENYYPVYIRSESAEEFNKYILENNNLHVGENKQVRINDMAELELRSTSNALHKENRQYVRVLSFEYMGSARFGDRYLTEVLAEMKAEMPIGYSAEKQTWSWGSEKTKRQYTLLLVLIVAIYLICSILFENLKQPLYIILMIPLSFIGLFLTFGLFDFYFDQGGYAAFVMLGGLTVNAGIFIVHDYNQRTNRNRRNLVKSVASKAQPILLTIFSTCFGLVPFIMHGQNEVFWFSLAAGTIGGLLFSLLGVFIFLPIWLYPKKAKNV